MTLYVQSLYWYLINIYQNTVLNTGWHVLTLCYSIIFLVLICKNYRKMRNTKKLDNKFITIVKFEI